MTPKPPQPPEIGCCEDSGLTKISFTVLGNSDFVGDGRSTNVRTLGGRSGRSQNLRVDQRMRGNYNRYGCIFLCRLRGGFGKYLFEAAAQIKVLHFWSVERLV
ncbi:hypothetical protein AWQ24_03720 [Picosynechococcus sp. PCC 8807]|nr:hypothetical protein AWQ24_03720 [Picosynechococcus sp. PCC 8807]